MHSNPKYDWEYNGSISFNISSYYGLRSYSQNLVCKLKDTRQAAAFLEKLAQPQPSHTELQKRQERESIIQFAQHQMSPAYNPPYKP